MSQIWLPFHLIDSCTTQTVASYWTTFPITHCTDHTAVSNRTLTWEPLHTPYKRHSFPLPPCRVLFSSKCSLLPSSPCCVLVFSLLYCSVFFSCFTEPFLVSVSSFSFSLVFPCCLAVWFLTFCLLPGLSLCLVLWILFADRRPCPFTRVLFCLALYIPVCHLFDPAS